MKLKTIGKKCTNKLVNTKMKVKTTPTTQNQLVECRISKAYKGISTRLLVRYDKDLVP